MTSASASYSDTVVLQLRNGDRLTGKFLNETTNAVVISTPWAKEMAVPLAEISSRQKIAEPVPQPATNKVAEIPTPKPVPPIAATPKPSGAKLKQRNSWHGKVDLGMDLGFGPARRQLYYAKAKVTYTPEILPDEIKDFASRFRNTLDYQATYGKTDGVLSANMMYGSSKTDFDLGKRWFVYNLIGAGYDEIRKISYQYEVGPGVGYRLITRSNFVLNTELGASYQVQNFEDRGKEDLHERFFLRLAEDATWSISKKLTLDEKLEFFPSVQDSEVFRIRFESNLRYALWGNIAVSLSVLDIYDTEAATGVGNNDLQIRSMLGINF